MENNQNSLEDAAKHFLIDQDAEHEDLEDFIRRISNYARVDKNGFVNLAESARTLQMRNKAWLVLGVRHLGQELQRKLGHEVTVSEKMTAEEIAKNLREKKDVIAARLKDLKDDGLAAADGKGGFWITRHSVSKLLSNLEGTKK